MTLIIIAAPVTAIYEICMELYVLDEPTKSIVYLNAMTAKNKPAILPYINTL